jgi:predicted enzyme related to lactoylglutathione lyase
MKLASTQLVTHDARSLARFYAAVTGLVPVGIDDYVELETATGILAISSQRGVDAFYAGAAEPSANRSVIIDFAVENVDRERARLGPIVAGFVMEPTDQPWGSRSMLFRDPDGNLISFSTQSPATSLRSCRERLHPEGAGPASIGGGSSGGGSADFSLSNKKETMKKQTAVHWTITGAISSFMLFSACYTGSHRVEFAQLGFPNYFRIELTVAKLIGAFALLVPAVPARVREWIYASFGIVLISAFIAKLNNGYPVMGLIEPLFVFATMVVALAYLNKVSQVQAGKQPR